MKWVDGHRFFAGVGWKGWGKLPEATLRYTHVSNRQVTEIPCPLDRLPL